MDTTGKSFICFIAFVVTVAGIPVENEDEPLILTTEVPTLDGDAYNKMVGGCTFKELAHTMAKHRRRFYLSFRTDKTTSCKDKFEPLKKHYLIEFESCYKKLYSGTKLANIMKKYRGTLDFTRKRHCLEIKYDFGAMLKQHPTERECPSGTIRNLNACFQGYYNMFKKNPGNPNLCKEYYDNIQCMKKTIAKCSFDFSKSSWVFDKELIGFCDKTQLQSLGSE